MPVAKSFKDRIANIKSRQEVRDKQFNEILEDLSHFKRDVSLRAAEKECSDYKDTDNFSRLNGKKLTGFCEKTVTCQDLSISGATFHEADPTFNIYHGYNSDVQNYCSNDSCKSMNFYNYLYECYRNSPHIYSDLCATRPSGSNMRQEMMEEIAIYEELAPKLKDNPETQSPELKVGPGKLSTKEDLETADSFTCSFCKEEFTIAESYKQHVIEEHYKKSVGTFWNQTCFQEKS